jgi:tetratricopeptide (TPR) repeat protein
MVGAGKRRNRHATGGSLASHLSVIIATHEEHEVFNVSRRAVLCGAGAAAALSAVAPMTAARAATASDSDADKLFTEGYFAAADQAYAAVLRQDPADAYAWAQRGYIALLSNRFAAAERFLSRAIKLNSSDTVSMTRLADCYVRQDDFTPAVALLRQAGDQIDATLYSAVSGSPYLITGADSGPVSFQTLDPLPSVTASVNGTAAPFTLDTGATFTFSAAMAAAAGISPVATVLVNHGAGPVTSYIGVVDSLRIGAVEIANVPVMWDDGLFTAAPGDGESVGVIGTTVFYHFQTTMDYAGRALTLRRAASAPGPVTAPLWLAPDHFIFSWGRVGESAPGPLLIDTGGIGLGAVLSTAQAAAGDVVPDYAAPESDLGVTCYPCTAEVALGNVRRAVPGVVGPFTATNGFGFDAEGVLSHEFFKPSSITFDFPAMTVTVPGRP